MSNIALFRTINQRLNQIYVIYLFSFLFGRNDFNSLQHIVQNDIGVTPHESFTHPYLQAQSENVLRNRQDKLKKLKKSKKGPYLVNPDFREVVEMSYWLIKFVGQFEKQYKDHVMEKSGAEMKSEVKDDNKTLFSKNAAEMISYARFFLKFLGSFEKLFKKV